MQKTRLNLQDDEQAVLDAASRVFGGFAASGKVTRDNAREFMRYSIRVAKILATTIDEEITSVGELEMPS